MEENETKHDSLPACLRPAASDERALRGIQVSEPSGPWRLRPACGRRWRAAPSVPRRARGTPRRTRRADSGSRVRIGPPRRRDAGRFRRQRSRPAPGRGIRLASSFWPFLRATLTISWSSRFGACRLRPARRGDRLVARRFVEQDGAERAAIHHDGWTRLKGRRRLGDEEARGASAHRASRSARTMSTATGLTRWVAGIARDARPRSARWSCRRDGEPAGRSSP